VPSTYAELKWGANVETNTTFETDSNGTTENYYTNDGRVEVVVEAETKNDSGYFVGGKGCFEIGVNGSVGACDAFFKLGNASYTLKVGSWEAEGLFSKGQDIYVAGTGAAWWYEANTVRGRGVDGMGVIFNAGENLTFDVKFGFDNDGDENLIGVRPVVKFSSGNFTVKAGGEYALINPFDTDSDVEYTIFGAAIDVSVTMGNITIGGTGTYGKEEWTDVDADTGVSTDGDETTMTDTAYINVKMGDNTLGLGAGFTQQDEEDVNEMYAFASYAMPLPVEGAWVKFGASFASGDNGSEDLTSFGGRVRFFYGF
jgi:hypothetical protein